MPEPNSTNAPIRRTKLGERFAYYAIGLSIGLIMVGLITRARQNAMQATQPSATTENAPTPEQSRTPDVTE